VAALWFLGRERQRTLSVWRIVFVVWALLLLPLLISVADGLATEGWPRGRFNKAIARLLILILITTIPAFLTSLCALTRTYRLASALALVTGLAYLVNGVLLIRATAPAKGLRLRFESVLDLILFGAQMASYLSIPVGVALTVGGIMTFRAARARA
jgi:ACR3 family arsenite efflux pump ArsB